MSLAQALSAGGRCRQGVTDTATKRMLGALPRCSGTAAAYVKARARLPQATMSTLARRTGERVAAGVANHGWSRERRVVLADGTTTTPPGMLAHLAESSQQSRRGFLGQMVSILPWRIVWPSKRLSVA